MRSPNYDRVFRGHNNLLMNRGLGRYVTKHREATVGMSSPRHPWQMSKAWHGSSAEGRRQATPEFDAAERRYRVLPRKWYAMLTQ